MCPDRKVLIIAWLMNFLENGKFCKNVRTLRYKKPFNMTKINEKNFKSNDYSHINAKKCGRDSAFEIIVM